jgi:hypothetical protein
MRTFGKVIVAGVVVFVMLQCVRPSIPSKPATAEIHAAAEVRHILEKDCYSCHSDQLRLSWFDQIVPAYWFVRHDILTAREHLDFSTLGAKPAATQRGALYESVNMVQLGAMPLLQFRKLHPEANVSPEELAVLKSYLAPWTQSPDRLDSLSADSSGNIDAAPTAVAAEVPGPVSLATIQPEFNGLPLDSTFESWKLLSATDRGDNNTFRFILGNDIAVKASQLGKISPWPEGARLAKIAWQKEVGSDGLIHPGKFVQVELMVKGTSRYRGTDGWNWGRWRGLDLKPYGHDAGFVNECMGCHMPLSGNDYVYTLPIATARVNRREVVNKAAALPESLPYQPLGWNAITMYADPEKHTMTTLYGNGVATSGVDPKIVSKYSSNDYPVGTVLALVTWIQREDPHWFGGRIPDRPQSVEFVEIGDAGQVNRYRYFTGEPLAEDHGSMIVAARRARFILGLPQAQLPKIR